MATDKRERQRQNRAVKTAEVKKKENRQKWINRAKRLGIWAVVMAALIIVATLIGS